MTSDKVKDKTKMILNGSATHIPFPIKLPQTVTKKWESSERQGDLKNSLWVGVNFI